MADKIGFISFIPDGGHIIPLLRIAGAFQKAGLKVICFLPEESIKYNRYYNLPVKSLGPVKEQTDSTVFSRISARSIFYNAFSSYIDLDRAYFTPLRYAVAGRLDHIKKSAREEGLSLLISDDDIFNPWYKLLAGYLKVPLLLHYSEGNCRCWTGPFTAAYGIKNHSPFKKKLTEIAGRLLSGWCSLYMGLNNKKKEKQIKKLLDNSFGPDSPAPPVSAHFTTGLAPFEKENLKDHFNTSQKEQILFPPVAGPESVTKDEKNEEIQKWLDERGDKPLLYISLGTMIRGEKKLFQTILEGLKNLDIHILWIAPEDQKKLIQESGLLPGMRVESFVHQPAVLSHKNVKAVITHGGAGTVQESLLAGKPLLCLPFIFDQPYNGTIIELLQVGITLSGPWVTGKNINRAMSDLLYSDYYSTGVSTLQGKMKTPAGDKLLLDYLSRQGFIKREDFSLS